MLFILRRLRRKSFLIKFGRVENEYSIFLIFKSREKSYERKVAQKQKFH